LVAQANRSLAGVLNSSRSNSSAQKGVQCDVFEKGNLDTKGNNLTQVGAAAEMATAGTEFSQAEVSGASQFKPRRDERRVEVKDGINLNLDTKGGHAGRERSTLDDPAAAVREDMRKPGQITLTIVVGEALDVERVHAGSGRPGREVSAVRSFIGATRERRDETDAPRSRDLSEP
jgi:hypothetical protein